MNRFINYKNGEITVNTYRSADASVTDLEDMLQAIDEDREESLVIDADGVKDALEDGECLSKMAVSQSAVETLHEAL